MTKFKSISSSISSKLTDIIKKYEDLIGISEVKLAQDRVLQAETRFIESQEKRRATQLALNSIQEKLKDIHVELDRTPRGDDRYLKLITQEHAIIRDERRLRDEALLYEKSERDNFSALSNAVRDSHERERAQGERTKYWSIMGSVFGTIVGLLGSTVVSRMRMKEIRDLVIEASGNRKDLTLQLHDLAQRDPMTANQISPNTTVEVVSPSDLQRAVSELSKLIKDGEKDTEKFLARRLSELQKSIKTHPSDVAAHETEPAIIAVCSETRDSGGILPKVVTVTSSLTLGLVILICVKIFNQ